MVAYERDVDVFIEKSSLLLDACSSARLSTKYRRLNDAQSFLTAKTYDPETGAIVKFRTDKTVDLGRLLVGSTRLTSKFCDKDIEQYKKSTEDAPMEGVTSTNDDTATTVKLSDEKGVSTGTVPIETKNATSTNANKKKKKKGKK